LETGYTIYGVNNLRFRTPSGGEHSFGSRIFAVYINSVLHFKDRLARVRPYVSGGFGMNVYYPTRDAKAEVGTLNPIDQPAFNGLDTSTKPAVNAGVGVKWRMTKGGGVGMRFDLRGLLSGNPQFHLIASNHNMW